MIEQLGPYRIEKQVGRGGMGTVYAGVNEETGEAAAIKILSAAFAEDANFRNRFLTEIETLKQLRHPNIVRLFGDGEQDGQLFYVMELVDGRSLQEELQAGHQYDWRETTNIAIQICQALKHAHDHGVIHRDLKPANLLRTPDDQIKLTDFGIAKLFGGSHLTAAGSVVGTADFMSPEQAEGSGVTYRSDLYSLGTVMFTLLARRPPFGGTSLPQVVHKLRYEEAPSVRRFNADVPSELEQIIAQLLNKAPEDRVATALVLTNRLKAMQHGLANLDHKTDSDESAGAIAAAAPPASDTDEQVTRISSPGRGPKTELHPTAVDDFDLREDIRRKSDVDSGFDITMATDGELARDGASSSQKTVAETPQPVNRFTTIEADQYRKRQETIDKPSRWLDLLKVAALAVGLIGVVGAIAWGLRPRSAEILYAEIVEQMGAGDFHAANDTIGSFLRWYEDGPHAEEVKLYELDIKSEWHAKHLVGSTGLANDWEETLPPVQVNFIKAMRSRAKTPDAARTAFEELVADATSNPATTPADRDCIEYARHQLRRLSQNAAAPRDSSP